MKCRACGSLVECPTGTYRPYTDYECEVFDCAACGARFGAHDDTVHDRLHSALNSPYEAQRRLGKQAAKAFQAGDVQALRRTLRASPKYRFVIDEVEGRADVRRLLEVGCSRGYLTSYFIAQGFDILGTDVSPAAVAEAARLFGDHFGEMGSDVVRAGRPYDAVFHVGTIGCVADPVQFTKQMLELVRPGGYVIFNAPNVDACRARSEVWGASTPPPDLVTLFPPDYWHRFEDSAHVDVTVTTTDPYSALLDWARRRSPSKAAPRRALFEVAASSQCEVSDGGSVRTLLRRGVGLVATAAARLHILRPAPAEFGVHVVMRRCA